MLATNLAILNYNTLLLVVYN